MSNSSHRSTESQSSRSSHNTTAATSIHSQPPGKRTSYACSSVYSQPSEPPEPRRGRPHTRMSSPDPDFDEAYSLIDNLLREQKRAMPNTSDDDETSRPSRPTSAAGTKFYDYQETGDVKSRPRKLFQDADEDLDGGIQRAFKWEDENGQSLLSALADDGKSMGPKPAPHDMGRRGYAGVKGKETTRSQACSEAGSRFMDARGDKKKDGQTYAEAGSRHTDVGAGKKKVGRSKDEVRAGRCDSTVGSASEISSRHGSGRHSGRSRLEMDGHHTARAQTGRRPEEEPRSRPAHFRNTSS